MNHDILIESELAEEFAYGALLNRAVSAALDSEGVTVNCEVNILVTDSNGIQEINLEQRGIDAPTDVLSFPMFSSLPGHPPTDDADAAPETGLIPLGAMVISLPRAEMQAQEYGHSVERELSYLAVHSVLHLLGYDHMDEGEEKAWMRAREVAALARIGLTRNE